MTDIPDKARPAPCRRIMRPLDIVSVMRSGTRQRQEAGRRILKRRYGFTDAQIDLMLSRGTATGKAPIAASHLVLRLPKHDRLSTKKPEGANEVLDWFFSRGSKIR